MNKTIKLVLILAVVAAAAYGIWWAYTSMVTDQPKEEQQQEEAIELTDDTTGSIDVALEGIDVADIDAEFSEIDEIVGQL